MAVLSARSLGGRPQSVQREFQIHGGSRSEYEKSTKGDANHSKNMANTARTTQSNQVSYRGLTGAKIGPMNSFLSKATTESSFKGNFQLGKYKTSFEGLRSAQALRVPDIMMRKVSLPPNLPIGPDSERQSLKESDRNLGEPQTWTRTPKVLNQGPPGPLETIKRSGAMLQGANSPRSVLSNKMSNLEVRSVKIHEYKPSNLSEVASAAEVYSEQHTLQPPKPVQNYLLRTPLDPNTFGGMAEHTEKEIWSKRKGKRGKEQKDGVFFNKIRHYSRIFNPKEKSTLIFGKLGKGSAARMQPGEVLETPHLGRMGNKPAQLNLGQQLANVDKTADSRASVETRSQFQKRKREIEQINERIITYSTFSVPNTAWGEYKPYQKEIEKIEAKATGSMNSTKPMSVVELWSRDYHGDVMSKAEHKKFRMRIQRYLHVLHRKGQGNSTISKLMLQTSPGASKD